MNENEQDQQQDTMQQPETDVRTEGSSAYDEIREETLASSDSLTAVQKTLESIQAVSIKKQRATRIPAFPAVTSSHATPLPATETFLVISGSFGANVSIQQSLIDGSFDVTIPVGKIRVEGQTRGENTSLLNYVTSELGPEGFKETVALLDIYNTLTGGQNQTQNVEVTAKQILQRMGKGNHADDNDLQTHLVNTLLYHAAKVFEWAFDIASARQHLKAAASIYERIGKIQGLASTTVNAGWLEYKVGLVDDAERFYAEALRYADRLESERHRSIIYGNFAYVALLRGDAERALTEAQRALQIANDVNDPRLIVWNLGLTGSALYQLGRDADRGFACFTQALDLCETFGFVDERLELIAEMIPTLLSFGKLEQAALFAAELERAISADASAVVMPVSALMKAADVYDAVADAGAARTLRERARSLLRERLEKLPDERTRAAYAALRDHRALIEEAATAARSPSLAP